MRWREHGGIRWLATNLPGAAVAFSARTGGSSEPPYDTLNLGILTGDSRRSVTDNRHRLATALGLDPARVVIGRQVHGSELVGHGGPQQPSPYAAPGSDPPEVDGHHTSETDLALLVFVADCLPIALSGPGGVAMIHGGWRGLADGILRRGVDAIGATDAAIGPAIGRCCYEVGDEVLQAFAPLGEGIADGRRLDLGEVARRQLEAAGVAEIESADACTCCNPDLYFSHRGQGPRTGRQAGLVWGVA